MGTCVCGPALESGRIPRVKTQRRPCEDLNLCQRLACPPIDWLNAQQNSKVAAESLKLRPQPRARAPAGQGWVHHGVRDLRTPRECLEMFRGLPSITSPMSPAGQGRVHDGVPRARAGAPRHPGVPHQGPPRRPRPQEQGLRPAPPTPLAARPAAVPPRRWRHWPRCGPPAGLQRTGVCRAALGPERSSGILLCPIFLKIKLQGALD